MSKEIRYQKEAGSMNIAQAVYAYISSRGIQQKFIAEKCGWSKQKTSAIIRGKKKMTAEELANICDALGVPYDYFYQIVSQSDGVAFQKPKGA